KHQPIEHKIIRTFKGEELVGQNYLPLDISDGAICSDDLNDNEYKIWGADFVSAEEGTGIVHIAPAFGEDDYNLAQANNIPMAMTIDESGNYIGGDWQGQNVWEVNKQIAKEL